MNTVSQLSVSAPVLDLKIDEILDGSGIPGAAVVVVTDSESAIKTRGGHVFSTQLIKLCVRDYMPLPLRAQFDVKDGRIISLSDANATYQRNSTATC